MTAPSGWPGPSTQTSYDRVRDLIVFTRHALTGRADTNRVDAAVVERAYILVQVARLHYTQPGEWWTSVFKGGGALRFVYLPDYRYFADLDFTVIEGSARRSRLRSSSTTELNQDGFAHADQRSGDAQVVHAGHTLMLAPPIRSSLITH